MSEQAPPRSASVALEAEPEFVELSLSGCAGVRPIEGGHIAWDCLGRRRGLYLVAEGQVVEHLRAEDWTECVHAIVDASALARDPSSTAFVRGPAFDALVDAADQAYADFDPSTLELPKVAGTLSLDTRDGIRRGVLPLVVGVVIAAAGLLTSDTLPSGDESQLVLLLLAAGIGLAFMSRGLKFYVAQAKSRASAAPGSVPAVARLESRPVILEQIGSVADLRFRVEVVSGDGPPFATTLDARLAAERIREFAVGDLVWVHHSPERGELHFDREVSSERPDLARSRSS